LAPLPISFTAVANGKRKGKAEANHQSTLHFTLKAKGHIKDEAPLL
jgi:hypothetical protein